MRIQVLGCGEAFDENYTNTSLLLRSDSTLLFDCGYSAPAPLWRALPDHSELDLIYISHPHADHYFGLPAVLARMWEEKRTKPLVILSQPPVLEQIQQLLELGYAGLWKRFEYPIQYQEARPRNTFEWNGMVFRFAPTVHGVSNLAVRVESAGRTFCYSGDGMFTEESAALVQDADLLVHEAYLLEPRPGHTDIPALVQMAAARNVKHLALTHVQRNLRKHPEQIRPELPPGDMRLSLLNPGDSFELESPRAAAEA